MAFVPSRLCQAVMAASASDLFTAAGNVLVRQAIVANSTGSPITARLSLIPTGGSADGTHLLLPDVTIGAKDLVVLDAFQILAAGDKLNGFASVNPGVVITISGVLL